MLLLCVALLLLSGSRGSSVPTLAALLVLFLAHVANLKSGFLKHISILGIVVSSSVVGYGLMSFDFFDLESRGQLFYDLTGRDVAWLHCMELIAENPLGGVDIERFGVGASTVAYAQNGAAGGEIGPEQVLSPHNAFLGVVTFQGVIVGGMYVVAHLIYLFRLIRLKYIRDTRVAALFLIPLIGFVCHLSIDMWFVVYIWVFCIFCSAGNKDEVYGSSIFRPSKIAWS
jgi:hypothetical protein